MLRAVFMSAFAAVVVPVMITVRIRIIFESAFRKRLCGGIRRTLNTGIELDPGIRKSILSAHADPAADQRIHVRLLQEPGQQTVTAAVSIDVFLRIIPSGRRGRTTGAGTILRKSR